MPSRIPRWGWIVLAAAGSIAAAVVAAGTWFVTSHRNSTAASVAVADAEFARLRAHFRLHAALVDMTSGRAVAAAPATAGPLRELHTTVFDTRGTGRLVRISVPYWLARQHARHDSEFHSLGELTFMDETEFDEDAIVLSLDQLEQHGPGLIVDHRHPSGGQFIAWVD